jgi:methylmalonyl-CoA mutase N-terminal domain/subunit
MRDRFGARSPRAQQLRFHTQTAGSTLTAQQPDSNIVRVAVQALAAVLGAESGVANTVDPLGGAWFIEQRTSEIEEEARSLIARIDAAGGTLAAIEAGLIQRQIQEAAYKAQVAVDSGTAVVVGVNRYQTDEPSRIEVFRLDPEVERQQVARVKAVRAARDPGSWKAALDAVESAARGRDNLVPPIIDAVEAGATVGEIADALRRVFGEYREVGVD